MFLGKGAYLISFISLVCGILGSVAYPFKWICSTCSGVEEILDSNSVSGKAVERDEELSEDEVTEWNQQNKMVEEDTEISPNVYWL